MKKKNESDKKDKKTTDRQKWEHFKVHDLLKRMRNNSIPQKNILKIMMKKIIIALSALLFSAVIVAQDKPNVVFVFADDLGWGDLGCYGHPYAKTPAIDKLASEGIRFTKFYVSGVTCSPSRTGIMTSVHPARYQKYMAGHGFAGKTTVTELFKKNGYTTGHFGKWHIGPDTKKDPVQDGTYGIDEIEVIGGNRISDGGRDIDLFDSAIDFIETNKERPFYVNIWGHISHYAIDPVDALVENFKEVSVKRSDFGSHMQKKFDDCEKIGGDIEQSMRNYLGDVYSLDMQVHKLLQKLEELGIADNTIVVFSSDHGPAPVIVGNGELKESYKVIGKNTKVCPSQNMLGYAGGLRGGKHNQYEGGVRSPLIVRWPGNVPANTVDDWSVVSGLDYLPTLCSLAGIPYDKNQFEGKNLADVWKGTPQKRKQALFWRPSAQNPPAAMLKGNWKMHQKGEQYALYDLSVDEQESKDVAENYPEVFNQMKGELDAWIATLPTSYVKKPKK